MQNFLSLWLNAGAQITHRGQVQRPRQKKKPWVIVSETWVFKKYFESWWADALRKYDMDSLDITLNVSRAITKSVREFFSSTENGSSIHNIYAEL